MIADQILDLYDDEVAKHPEGLKVAEAKDAIRESVRDLIGQLPRDIEREVNSAINQAVDSTRDRRSRSITRDLEFILDYFANPSEAALIPDSRMSWAIRLGTVDGADKTLRNWTSGDFTYWASVRSRHAQEALAAAGESEEVAERIVERMIAAGVSRFGDVDWAVA